MSNDGSARKVAAQFATITTPSGVEARIPVAFRTGPIEREGQIEEWLLKNFKVLELDAALIGEQVKVTDNKTIDLFGVTRKGQLCVVELKRDAAERAVFIQIVDYARLLSGSLCDHIDAMCRSKVPAANGLSDIYQKHFNKELPAKRTRNPLLVVIAEEFNESEIEMALLLTQEHHFCIRLLSYEADLKNGELSVTLRHEVFPEDQLRITSKMPAQVLEVRVYESSEWLWNRGRAENFIPKTSKIAQAIAALDPAQRIWILVYLDNHGHVAYGMLEEPISAGLNTRLKIKWEFAVEREQHVFRGRNNQPVEDVEQLANEEKWAITVGWLRFRTEHSRRKTGDGGKRLKYKRKRSRKEQDGATE